MNKNLKVFLSFFLLTVFLFPSIEKELHSYSHQDDFHCRSHTQQHFHEQQHNCSICDFTVGFSDNPLKVHRISAQISHSNYAFIQLPTQATSSACSHFFSLRAPPVQS